MRVITLNENKVIIGIKYIGENYILCENEIETELGDIGQVMQEDGTFITPAPVNTVQEPTLEDKINYLYYKNKGVIA